MVLAFDVYLGGSARLLLSLVLCRRALLFLDRSLEDFLLLMGGEVFGSCRGEELNMTLVFLERHSLL